MRRPPSHTALRRLADSNRRKIPGRIIPTVAVCLLLASPASASPASSIASVMRRETAAFSASDWRTLWRLHSPRYRDACPYVAWVAASRRTRASFTPDPQLTVRPVTIRVHGGRAVVSYTIRYVSDQGTVTTPVIAGDWYVLVGGRWLDDLDGLGCR